MTSSVSPRVNCGVALPAALGVTGCAVAGEANRRRGKAGLPLFTGCVVFVFATLVGLLLLVIGMLEERKTFS